MIRGSGFSLNHALGDTINTQNPIAADTPILLRIITGHARDLLPDRLGRE
jgi:hypothetical protein